MYHAGDRRFASAIPYASIIVELDDAPGALLAANLLEAPYTEAKVGRRVEAVFEPLNDDITLPQFRLRTTQIAGGDRAMWDSGASGSEGVILSRDALGRDPLAAHIGQSRGVADSFRPDIDVATYRSCRRQDTRDRWHHDRVSQL
jgi:hypothetical protein